MHFGAFRESDYLDLATIEVSDQDAIETTRELIRLGFSVGPSSGLSYHAALIAAQSVWPAKVVTVFPDRMERYFSTELFWPFLGEHSTTPARGAEQRIPCLS